MSADSSPRPIFASRYVLHEQIGAGGYATVFRATDLGTKRDVALKRLGTGTDEAAPAMRTLFEREYHVLTQLEHPRIIKVYDFGVEDGSAYYTMELLSGRDARELAPIDWPSVCLIMRDIGSSLALLHSRRLVHRDVTHRNVRITDDGRAKLLDFGAMGPMGPARELIGTPPFVAPEVLGTGVLEGASDLYALGATAYYLLSRRHAYRAHTFGELRELWQKGAQPLNELVPSLPEPLVQLVMELLEPNPLARPQSAALIAERFAAIGGVPHDASLEVPRAYLTRPSLVGRSELRTLLAERIQSARATRGGVLIVEGMPGMGVTRALDTAALVAKTAGMFVLRASAADAPRGEFGLMHALIADLKRTAPNIRRELGDEYSGVFTTFHGAHESPLDLGALDDASRERAPRLRALLLEFSLRRPLMLVVHGLDDADMASQRLLLSLAQAAPAYPLLVVLGRDRSNKGSRVSRDIPAEVVMLYPLSRPQVAELVRSLFGNVPGVKGLARSLYPLSQGSPGMCIALAQQLIDTGVIRFVRGSWRIPARIDVAPLVRDLAAVLRAQIARLSEDARELLQVLALADRLVRFENYLELTSHGVSRRLHLAISELVSAQLLIGSAPAYVLASPQLVAVLQEDPGSERAHSAHERIARMLLARGEDAILVADHEMRAGLTRSGIDRVLLLATEAFESSRAFEPAWVVDFTPVLERTLELAVAQGRSASELVQLRLVLLVCSTFGDARLVARHAPALEQQLGRDLCLSQWPLLAPELLPEARLGVLFLLAQARHDADPHACLAPLEALDRLGRYVLYGVGPSADDFDQPRLERMLEMIAPFVPVMPVFELVREVVAGTLCGIEGQHIRAVAHLRRALAILDDSPTPVLPANAVDLFRREVLYGMARMRVIAGDRRVLEWADEMEKGPLHAAGAWCVRRMHHLFRGELGDADACREKLDALGLKVADDRNGAGILIIEMLAARCLDDVERLDALLFALDSAVRRYPGCRVIRLRARIGYARMCGDYARALRLGRMSLRTATVNNDKLFALFFADYMLALIATGEPQRAAEVLEQLLAIDTIAQDGSYDLPVILAAGAEAEAALGHAERAHAHLDHLRRTIERLDDPVLLRLVLHETTARVAMQLADDALFEASLRELALLRAVIDMPSLAVRHARFEQEQRASIEARRPGGKDVQPLRAADEGDQHSVATTLDGPDSSSTQAQTIKPSRRRPRHGPT